MTKPYRDANPRWPGFLLAALVAVLVTLFGAGTASAATASAAQTRVGAHTLMAQVFVGPRGGIGAGQRLGNDRPTDDSALATGVAAETGSELAAPTARALGSDLADAAGGTLKELKSGYSVTIPSGSRGIVVRVMEEGGGRSNYYRVSIPGKQAFTVGGEASTDPALTHIPISGTSLQDILSIIEGLG